MIWNSGLLNIEVVTCIIDDVISDRQRLYTRNLSSKPGSRPKDILQEIIDNKVFERDYIDVTSGFIYKKVSYETCINTLKKVLDSNIVPEEIKSY